LIVVGSMRWSVGQALAGDALQSLIGAYAVVAARLILE
jgi:hypothetical protein